jgi:hypothetical protein
MAKITSANRNCMYQQLPSSSHQPVSCNSHIFPRVCTGLPGLRNSHRQYISALRKSHVAGFRCHQPGGLHHHGKARIGETPCGCLLQRRFAVYDPGSWIKSADIFRKVTCPFVDILVTHALRAGRLDVLNCQYSVFMRIQRWSGLRGTACGQAKQRSCCN